MTLIESYVNNVVNFYDGNWAYTYTVDDKLGTEIETHRIDPSKAFLKSDTILAVNGSQPSQERLERHERRMQRRLDRRRKGRRSRMERDFEEGNEKARILDMLVKDSIQFIKQEGDLLYLSFRGMEEEAEKIFEHLTGTFIIDTNLGYIKEVQVRVTEPFSPYFLISVKAGFISVRFTPNDGHPMLSEITWVLVGQAFFFRNLDTDREIVWTDITKVSES